MPPQETNAGSATEGDAAVRGLDLTILGVLERFWHALQKWRRRLNSRTSLHDLSDRELKDIGMTREEIDHIAPHRAIDALRDRIHSRGVM
jgi:uncharacterized protein YjiS (DUF1127 family)